MNQTSLDFTAAKAHRDIGIQRVADANATWMDHALATLESYARLHDTLRIEQFRAWWETVGGEPPKSHHAWGALGRAGVTRGLIQRIGYVPAESVKTHCHPVALYRSLVYLRRAA